MHTPLNELLCRLETLTAHAKRECALDMCRARDLIRSRTPLIAQLEAFVNVSGAFSGKELDRIRLMQDSGSDLLTLVCAQREQWRAELRDISRNRSFAACLVGVLDIEPAHQTFDL